MACDQRGLTIDEKKFETFVNMREYTSENLYQELLQFCKDIKLRMYNTLFTPWFSILFYTLVSSILLLFILIRFNAGLEYFIIKDLHMDFFVQLGNIVGIYSLSLLQLLFIWPGWGIRLESGFIPRIFDPLLTIKILYSSKTAFLNYTSSPEGLIYHNEVINLVLALTTTSFTELLKVIDSIPYILPEILIFLAIFSLLRYFCHHSHSKKWEITVYVFLLLFQIAFVYTDQNPTFYLFHFNFFALAVYFGCTFFTIYYIIQNRQIDIVIPLNVVLFLLYKDSCVGRFLILLFNYQYLTCLIPSAELMKLRLVELFSKQVNNQIFHLFFFSRINFF